jgi:hypothetical protein|nr:hypothetical protein [uncultured Flavobacterium sp.]
MDTAEIKEKIKFDPKVNLGNFKPKFNGSIQFDHIRSKKPLPALVEANRIANDNGINVSVVVFITDKCENPSITIQQMFAISNLGTNKLQFFIDYTYKEDKSKKFDIYELNFLAKEEKLPKGVTLKDIDTVEVFLVDTDPIGSRGTETSVQPTS